MKIILLVLMAAFVAFAIVKRIRQGAMGDVTSSTVRELTSNQEADQLLEQSQPTWLFKHSAACSVSFMAMAHFSRYLKQNPAPSGLVIVQKHRAVSNYLAERFGIEHESPQLFLLRGGQVLWHTSHGGITMDAMQEAYQSTAA
jgi:bacillithiol system protein YtxJ